MLKPSSKPPPVAAPTVTPNLRKVRREMPPFDDCAPFCESSNPWDMSGSLRGFLFRRADAVVCPTAADVAGHGGVDIRIGWIGVARDQRGRRHHLPRLTVAALHDVKLTPCL